MIKTYDELNFFEKILFKLHLKKALKFSAVDFKQLVDSTNFLEENPRSSFTLTNEVLHG